MIKSTMPPLDRYSLDTWSNEEMPFVCKSYVAWYNVEKGIKNIDWPSSWLVSN